MFFSTTRIGDVTYLGLMALSFFVGFVIHFRKNISEIDLKNMKVILQKTQKVKDKIDNIALNLAKIIANLSAYSSGSWLNRKKLNDQIENLLSTLSVNSSEKQRILDLPRTVEKMMKNKDILTPTEKKKIDEMFNLEEKSGDN
ncbi:MAG: hypothetical protein ABIJ05_02855 [Patescibacteria group bacterium]